MLKQRIITALILLPVVYILLFNVALDYFAAAILVIVYLMAIEWAKLSNIKTTIGGIVYAFLVSTINLAFWYFDEALIVWPSLSWPSYPQNDLPLFYLFAAFAASLLAILVVLTFSTNKRWWQIKPSKELFGLILLPAFFIAFVSIRNIGYIGGNFLYGGYLLLFMLLLIWAADTGAFVSGKLFGKHKLTKVSPNKTWEGVVGGLALSMLIGWGGISALSLKVNNIGLYLGVILLIGIVSVFGDLFESALKRVANIKDSGNLLPGHGGLLDRLDSTITVAPLFYLSFSYLGWFNG